MSVGAEIKASRSGTKLFDFDKANRTVKSKIEFAVNNVKYGWVFNKEANFKSDYPIWLLGKFYHHRYGNRGIGELRFRRPNSTFDHDLDVPNYDDFIADFTSRFWFTYRTGFASLSQDSYQITDCGWGCMLRSGQMMLAQGLVLHFLGRSWNLFEPHDPVRQFWHKKILSWFLDQPEMPFSIHSFVSAGRSIGKSCGDWYGPASTACLIKKIFKRIAADDSVPELNSVTVYLASDCSVSLREANRLCSQLEVDLETSTECLLRVEQTASPSPPFANFVAASSASAVSSARSSWTAPLDGLAYNDNHYGETSFDLVGDLQEPRQESWVDVDDVEETGAVTCLAADDFVAYDNDDGFDLSSLTEFSPTSLANVNYEPVLRGDAGNSRNPSANAENSNSNRSVWLRSLLIFIPLRLGSEHLNPLYMASLQNILSLDYCLGIIGGKPKKSMFFVGYHGDRLIYLDPHYLQNTVQLQLQNRISHKTFHCPWPKLLQFKSMDPSCTVGFYIKDYTQLLRFKQDVETLIHAENEKAPLFTVVEDVPSARVPFPLERQKSRAHGDYVLIG